MVQITQDISVTSAVDKMTLTHEWRHLRAVTGTADFGRNLKLLRKFAGDVDLFFFSFFCFSCACLMRPPSPGTKPYQEHYLSVYCVLRALVLYSLIRRTPPTFSGTAITDLYSDTTFSSSELTGCGYPGLLDRKNRSDLCRRWESNPRLPA